MSWSHVGSSQKNRVHSSASYESPRYRKTNRFTHKTRTVSTTAKVITCALIILILAAPVVAAQHHVNKCETPGMCLMVKANAPLPNMRSILVDSSWPSSFHAPHLFQNILPAIPHGFHVSVGLTDFFENFVQKYNISRKSNYPHLPKAKVGTLEASSEPEMVGLARDLFQIYEDVETGPFSHGCLWRSKLQVVGTGINRIGSTVQVVVDYVRSSLYDLRKPKIVQEMQDDVIVERSTYEAVQQRAIFSFEDDAVFVEVISNIQEELFDPPLSLLHREEKEPWCS